jgi:hypothetical protein
MNAKTNQKYTGPYGRSNEQLFGLMDSMDRGNSGNARSAYLDNIEKARARGENVTAFPWVTTRIKSQCRTEWNVLMIPAYLVNDQYKVYRPLHQHRRASANSRVVIHKRDIPDGYLSLQEYIDRWDEKPTGF